MTRLVFYSLTGQCRRFIRKLDLEGLATELTPANPLPQMVEDFILLVPSYDEADVEVVDDFLADNHHFCIGLIGSGNRNFGPDFCKTARRYAQRYDLPILYEFEFNGTDQDVAHVKGILTHES